MLKIGALSFINSLPFFYPLFTKKVAFDGEFEVGTPTEINELLEKGDIDIGLISSVSFLANRDKYVLLTNLGIGATAKVQSVCLYTKEPVEALGGKVVAIPHISATSSMLLKVLCFDFWNVSPKFIEYPKQSSLKEIFHAADGVLIIGDECLTAKIPPHYHVTDLSTAWYTHTKKSFVFAVFATRCDRWMEFPDEVRDFHRALSDAYEYSQNNFEETIRHAQSKTRLNTTTLQDYYKALDYYLDSAHFQGLEHFAQLSRVYDSSSR